MMRLDLATAEYIGARAQQQDLAAAMPFASGAMLVLADGLGGHESGADASRIVVETFREAVVGGRFSHAETRRQALRETVERANARIAEGVNPAHGHRGMASTVVAAVVAQGELSWVSVGDSHLYVWRGGRLHKLNEDHSQAGLMVRSGQYQASDPEVQAVRSVLVSALTGRKLEIVDLPQQTFRLEPGDVLMLASDGLNTLGDDEIEGIVAEVRAQGAVRLSTTLLERVRSRRLERQDNTTVAIARILEPPRLEPPEPVVRKVPVSEPLRKVEIESQRRPQDVQAMSLDDTSEARTERVVPGSAEAQRNSTSNDSTMPTPMPTPAVAAVPEEPKASSASQPQLQPALAAQPAVGAHEGAARHATREKPPEPAKAIPEPIVPASKPGVPAPQPSEPALPASRPRVAPPREGAVSARSKPSVPDSVAPRAVRSAPAVARKPPIADGPLRTKAGLLRVLIGALLVALIAAGFAIAALAAFKPQWLSGLVPGFSASDATVGAREQTAPTEPAAKPAAAPVSAPVPLTRPAQEPPARPDAADAQRAPVAQQKAAIPAVQTEEAAKGQAIPIAPAESRDAATPLTADPPLTEPQRPAKAPSAKQKRNNNNPPAN